MSDSAERGQRTSGDGSDDPGSNPQQLQQQPATGQVNPELLQMLCDLGIDEALATQVNVMYD